MAKGRLLKWQLQSYRKKLIYYLCSKLYQDDKVTTKNSIIVAGAARSGTTWLANIIASQVPCRIMFEPFHSVKVKAFRPFHYFHYMRPTDPNDELWSYCFAVLTGQVRDKWIDRRVDRIWPKYRLIKEIRANLFLKWIHARFPNVPQLFIIRHPCAVVSSRMKLGWATDSDISPFLSQPKLINDFLYDKLDIIKSATTAEEKHAVIWCISNLVPLQQFNTQDLVVIFYENLLLHPKEEIRSIFNAIQHEYRDSVFTALDQPSSTVSPKSAVVKGTDMLASWQKELSSGQTSNILDVVKAFGLDHLYCDSVLPLI